MKKYIIGVLTLPLLFSFQYADAQKVEQKKVVIVKEIEDENGKVTKEEQVLTGDDAEKYIRENKGANGMISISIDKDISSDAIINSEEKQVTVDIEEKDGKEVKNIKIRVKDEDGEEKIMEWNGEGEMPEEMKEHMEEVDIEIENGTEDKIVKIISRGGADHTIIELEEELDIPDEVKEKLKKHGIKLGEGNAYFFSDDDEDEIVILKDGKEMKWQTDGTEEKKIIKKRIKEVHIDSHESEHSESGKKAVLGVMVQHHINGIEILDVMEDTPASKAGIMKGDIIFQVGNKTVGSVLQLNHELKSYEGKTVKIKFLREGKEVEMNVIL